jgi:hypothetical protein
VEAQGDREPLHPMVEQFQELIDAESVVRIYLNQIFEQVRHGKQYCSQLALSRSAQ